MTCSQCQLIRYVTVFPYRCACGKVYNVPALIHTNGRPGDELKRLIPKQLKSHGCGCEGYAQQMNLWGVEGCLARFDEIVDHLVAKAKEKGIPQLVSRPIAKRWVRQAIESATPREIDNGDWFVAITTAPRKQPTLFQCIDSIRAAGWEPVVFAEPNSPQSNAKTITNPQQLGVWHNWLSSVKYALENSSASLILTVQDDTLFHPDSRTFTESILWPASNIGFLSLYTPKHYSLIREPGINHIYTRSLWGACALVWPRKILEQVIEHPIAKSWAGARPKSGNKGVYESRRKNPHTIANSDTAIGKIMNSMARSMYFIDPSPVSHIAVHSTINHGGNLGRRNCYRCADHSIPLSKQVPHNTPNKSVV